MSIVMWLVEMHGNRCATLSMVCTLYITFARRDYNAMDIHFAQPESIWII